MNEREKNKNIKTCGDCPHFHWHTNSYTDHCSHDNTPSVSYYRVYFCLFEKNIIEKDGYITINGVKKWNRKLSENQNTIPDWCTFKNILNPKP